MVASWISFVGFGLGIMMTNRGLLEPMQEWLRATVIGEGEPATLGSLLRLSPWVLIAAFALLVGLWFLRTPSRAAYQGGWSWPVTGLVIGVIGVVAWPLSALTGRQFGLSVTEPAYSYMRFFLLGQGEALSWASFMWIGIPLGSYVSARSHGEFKWRSPGPQRLLQALGGGVVMGIGAAIGGGCTVGHSLTGFSTLAMSSISATAGIVAGVWTASFILFGDVRVERSVRHAERA